MTTFVPLITSPNQIFQFQPTLDGVQYTVQITWNMSGQRWYFNLYTLTGTLVLAAANIASPDDYDINMIGGYFTTSTLVFRESSQTFEINP